MPEFDLERFVEAQAHIYDQALGELRAGNKQSHWMWFIFPQIKGLGASPMSQRFAITSLDEAKAYLVHPVLGPRLIACTSAMLTHAGRSAHDILHSPDDLKFRSSMTLFQSAAPYEPVLAEALEVFFEGDQDERTIALL